MKPNALRQWNPWQLRGRLIGFFLGLAIPLATLIYYAFDQLKWEAFHMNQVVAEELAQRIDEEYRRIIAREEARPFTDYAFLNVAGSSERGVLQRSPLSVFPANDTIPGLIGYFQVDGQGRLTTPLLPSDPTAATSYGIDAEEQKSRQAKQAQIAQILSQNHLVNVGQRPLIRAESMQPNKGRGEAGATGLSVSHDDDQAEQEVAAQANFDKLVSSSLRDGARQKHKSADLDKMEAAEAKKSLAKSDEYRLARKEQALLPAPSTPLAKQRLDESISVPSNEAVNRQALRITTFESEIDPMEMSLLGSGQFVLFRKVWRNGERQIQGLLLDRQAFAWDIVRAALDATSLASMTDLTVGYQGQSLGTLNGRTSRYPLDSGRDLHGQLLYQTTLSAPLGDFELTFRITRLPLGPGTQVVATVATFMALMLIFVFYQMYRLGMAQIRLARQQQDFISAVSHELKTPLTSIRMYGEMLREGWVGEEKKRRYYDYIFDESERLSRLINNVLQLARMTRSEMPINARGISLSECMELIRAKVGVQIERAGFKPVFHSVAPVETHLKLDPDHLSQIMINLVDNAIKFSAKQDNKLIEISCDALRDKTAVFCVRDYGPGIAKDQMKKIFNLFYRSENELTRETVGTGIGLALVHQLVVLMGGRIDVVNKNPGAEFRVYFPVLPGKKVESI